MLSKRLSSLCFSALEPFKSQFCNVSKWVDFKYCSTTKEEQLDEILANTGWDKCKDLSKDEDDDDDDDGNAEDGVRANADKDTLNKATLSMFLENEVFLP